MTSTTEIYTLSLHDALPISSRRGRPSRRFVRSTRRSRASSERARPMHAFRRPAPAMRSEEHTSELQSLRHLVCRLLLEKKKHITHTSEGLIMIQQRLSRYNG